MWDGFVEFVVPVIIVLIVLAVLIGAFCVPWTITERRLINQQYKANYGFWEVFWCSGTIKDYLEQGRKLDITVEN